MGHCWWPKRTSNSGFAAPSSPYAGHRVKDLGVDRRRLVGRCRIGQADAPVADVYEAEDRREGDAASRDRQEDLFEPVAASASLALGGDGSLLRERVGLVAALRGGAGGLLALGLGRLLVIRGRNRSVDGPELLVCRLGRRNHGAGLFVNLASLPLQPVREVGLGLHKALKVRRHREGLAALAEDAELGVHGLLQLAEVLLARLGA
mmetsp:Transcript_45245/g.121806  ORF Transcript_45245/g.121806 Transcript_45245/m.121806 type:complete len:206 (+) Transcript_45245:136-753(+)